jgi:hypothetical protein
MPWKEGSVMDERLRFGARLLDGEAMSEVCRGFSYVLAGQRVACDCTAVAARRSGLEPTL